MALSYGLLSDLYGDGGSGILPDQLFPGDELDPRIRLAFSEQELKGLNPAFGPKLNALQEALKAQGLEVGIGSGLRGNDEQARLYAQGRTAPGPIVTNAPPGSSYHNHGAAVDLAPKNMGADQAGPLIGQAIRENPQLGLKWGGNFKSLYDPLHVQSSDAPAGMAFGPGAPPPSAPQQQAPGFMDRLGQSLNNPLVQFGLGLASGKTPQEGFGNALQAQLARQRIEAGNTTSDIKEYQYAVATGAFKGSFPQFLQWKANTSEKLGLNPVYTQDANGKFGLFQLSDRPGGTPKPLNLPGGQELAVPNRAIDTGTGTQIIPNKGVPTGAPVPQGSGQTTAGGGVSIPKDLQGKAEQTKTGDAIADAKAKLPGIETDTENAIGYINTLKKHPGLSASVGFVVGRLPAITPDAADFRERLAQIDSGAWTSAVQTMRGLGALSDAEGRKLSGLRARLSTVKSETDFKIALDDAEKTFRQGLENARKISSGELTPKPSGSGAVRKYNPETGKIE